VTTADPTTCAPGTRTLDAPWPFTGREDELELVRRALSAGRGGIVVTGPAGCGKTRLVDEAVRGADCVRAAGTPETRSLPFAAFAHVLPEHVTLPGALRLLSGVRQLVVDDAHLLDDSSAALVHQLALHGRTRLLVAATDGVPAPGAVTRLWTRELMPRLVLEPLPAAGTARLLAAGAGTPLEPLTEKRLHRLVQGDLRLLRELLGALRAGGQFAPVAGTGERAWRGPLPLTATVRERTAPVLDRPDAAERETLDRLAFAEPLPLPVDRLDMRALEQLEYDRLVHVDDHGLARLAHPLYGPALRAVAGRLRARRLAGPRERYAAALEAERAALAARVDRADVRPLPAPAGEWAADEGAPLPAEYAAVRARFARLRGQLREAAAWARLGLATAPRDPACADELALAAAQSGDAATAREALAGRRDRGAAAVWEAAVRGDLDAALAAVDDDSAYDAVRLGAPHRAAGPLDGVLAEHADALARRDGAALDRAAEHLERRGLLLFAAEAYAQAVRAHRDPRAAGISRARAAALARRCQSARTPALSGLVLGELTARQRQIVTLAAAGLSNRQIAERLTLSIRTVGNHLYSAYARLGAGDRASLPWLVEFPDTRPA
jgi:DNA-binding CsgD family transcriptional regulator